MVGDSIRAVRQAEDEAEDIIEAAAEQVERLDTDARQRYSMKILSAKERARHDAASIRGQAIQQAQEEIDAVWKDANRQKNEMGKRWSSRVDEAVAMVLDMLEGFGAAGPYGD
jgi:vacuolar-type H+-ATPase subunit H